MQVNCPNYSTIRGTKFHQSSNKLVLVEHFSEARSVLLEAQYTLGDNILLDLVCAAINALGARTEIS